MPVIVIPLLNTASDTKSTNGIALNNEWEGGGVLQHGTHKSGNPQSPYLRFEDLNIPPTSVINSASITVEQISTVAAGSMLATVQRIEKDAVWNATSNPDKWTGPSLTILGWHVELLDVATQLVITGAAAQARSGGIDLEGDNGVGLKRAAQGVTGCKCIAAKPDAAEEVVATKNAQPYDRKFSIRVALYRFALELWREDVQSECQRGRYRIRAALG